MLKTKARIAGALYLVSIIARIVSDGMVRDRMVVSRDAAATAANILANQSLWGIGFIADMIAFATFIAVNAYLYDVFRPVDRSVSLIAMLFGVISAIAHAVSAAFHLAASAVLGTMSGYLASFTPAQLQEIAFVLLRVRYIAFHNVGLVFLGLYLVLIGYLILRSRLVPRLVGVLALAAGVAYLAFLSQPFAQSLLPNLLIPVGVGQIALTLWLLVFGVESEGGAEPTSV